MATKKDIDDAENSIKKLDADMATWQKDLNGSRFKTELDATIDVEKHFKDFTARKKTLKIEGGFTKIQVGKSDQTVYGMKGELMWGLSLTGILAMEKKYVEGFAETVIKGNKSDTIVGAKVDLLGGHKYERVKGEKFNLGASPEIGKKSKVVSFVEKGTQKFGAWIVKGTDRIFENSKKVQEEIGAAKQQIEELTKKHTDLKETIQDRYDHLWRLQDGRRRFPFVRLCQHRDHGQPVPGQRGGRTRQHDPGPAGHSWRRVVRGTAQQRSLIFRLDLPVLLSRSHARQRRIHPGLQRERPDPGLARRPCCAPRAVGQSRRAGYVRAAARLAGPAAGRAAAALG